ncbi:large conductance mechanosensitive channel protein MscL [Flavobacterium sp.]|uniref:large conductance mechanosensitive channel protein MscL n=1 Tax=Flavobacterium sp. TaxID=239 RepID=UPI00286B83BC|nr:large conductance mechanosensitive channel protein MscL [Flavobacterium sp.]
MLKEFKSFIMTGNVIEFAVAVIMAGAVGAVVNGFVADIAMPLVGMLTGGMDFSALKYVLSPEVKDAAGAVTSPENAVRYGAWINSIISLVVIGFVMFMIIRAYNKTKKPVEAPAPAGPTQEELLTQIRDLLKK